MRKQLLALVIAIGLQAAYTPVFNPASAQSPEEEIVELNTEAMRAYNDLDIVKSISTLNQALQVAQQNGLAGALVAGTHMNLGVVYIAGMNDHAQGHNHFLQALCFDPGTLLDPLLSSPDIESLFQQAQQAVNPAVCGNTATAVAPAPAPVPAPAPAPVVNGAAGPVPTIVHQPPLPQVERAPIPVYAELTFGEKVQKVFLYYRGSGMDDYKRVSMVPYGKGGAYQISCHDVWAPRVRYYVTAVDGEGRVVAAAGAAQSPLEAPVVSDLGGQPGPALPGQMPPAACTEVECPPDVSGEECEKPDYRALGEECDSDAECQPGLFCHDRCLLPSAGTQLRAVDEESPGELDEEEPGEFARGFIQLGFSLGLSRVQSGMFTDRPPPGAPDSVFDTGGNFVTDGLWVPDGDSYDRNGNRASDVFDGQCPADGTVTGPHVTATATGDTVINPSKYCVQIRSPGFQAFPALRLSGGYFITERIGVSGMVRYQLDAGEGTLAGILLGARGEFLVLGSQQARGLSLSLFLGASMGQIQVKPPSRTENEAAPFAVSGLAGAHAGVTLRYRFHRSFGLFLAPELDLQFPDFLMNIDLTLGPEVAF